MVIHLGVLCYKQYILDKGIFICNTCIMYREILLSLIGIEVVPKGCLYSKTSYCTCTTA